MPEGKELSLVTDNNNDLSLEDYIEKSKASRGSSSAYTFWPEKAQNDIQKMIEANDSGKGKLRIQDAIKWLKVKYDIDATRSQIRTFVTTKLGRLSWTVPNK